jgi:ADP-ribose pyrophosphatase
VTEEIYQGQIFSVEKRDYISQTGKKKSAEIVTHPGAVSMFPILDGKICLVKQWREPAQEELLEIPAGTLELGEKPIDCAMRELQEEIGYKGKCTLQSMYYASPGFCTQKIFHFLATDLTPSRLIADDTEDIEIVTLSLKELENAISQGKIIDGKTIIGLYLYLNGR